MSPTASPYGQRADAGPPGLAAKLLGFCEELRGEGVAVGTSEILDAFAALEQVPWESQDDFREALATTIAKSQEDRRLFELLFERWFFRAAEAEAIEREIGEGAEGERHEGAERLDIDELREQIREAIVAGNDGEMRDLARLAIAAFGRQGEGSGVVGVDVQRIRRTLELTAGTQPRDGEATDGAAERPPIEREQLNRFERHLRRELERQLIERTETLPPARPLAELDRALPTSPTQDLAAVHRAVSQMKRRLATLGHEQRGRRKRAHTVDVRRTMRASLETGGVPMHLRYRPKRPRRPEIYVLCDVSTSVTSASVFFLSVLHALHDSFRKLRSFVFIERISEVTEIFEHERDFREIARRDLQRGRRRRRLRLHRLRPRLARVPDRDLRRPRPALDRDRARRRAHQRPRAARRGLRPGGRARRPPLLAQPRAEALLELRRLGDGRLRAPLRRRLRVLDHPPPGELRQRRRRRRAGGGLSQAGSRLFPDDRRRSVGDDRANSRKGKRWSQLRIQSRSRSTIRTAI